MSIQAGCITKTQTFVVHETLQPLKGSSSAPFKGSSYQIEEHTRVKTPVPFNSPFGVAAHLATWTFCTLYFGIRLSGVYESPTWWLWLIYFCEAAFAVQDFQTAFELTFSLCGPREFFEHTQYALKGPKAPKVHVLVTSGSPCPNPRPY
jgi:hypothetical protein